MELDKQIGWSSAQPTLYHWRNAARHEVDFVLERPGGEIVGIEVKASADVDASHFKGLRSLRDAAGERFLRGIVLYGGPNVVPFGDGMWAMPIQSLWMGE